MQSKFIFYLKSEVFMRFMSKLVVVLCVSVFSTGAFAAKKTSLEKQEAQLARLEVKTESTIDRTIAKAGTDLTPEEEQALADEIAAIEEEAAAKEDEIIVKNPSES